MILVGLVLLKYLVYFGVCLAALPMLHLAVADRTSFALKWAGARLLLGLALGLPIAWLFASATDAKVPDTLAYLLSFVLIRYIAWLLVLGLIAKTYRVSDWTRGQLWVVLGVIASVTLDGLAVAAGADQVRLWC